MGHYVGEFILSTKTIFLLFPVVSKKCPLFKTIHFSYLTGLKGIFGTFSRNTWYFGISLKTKSRAQTHP